MKLIKLLLYFGLLNGIIACSGEGIPDPENKDWTKPVTKGIDAVKLISPGLKRNSGTTMQQKTYPISSSHRLLLRMSTLDGNNMLLEQPVIIKVELKNLEQKNLAKEQLLLCPILRNWMMRATWSKAHPYKGGEWSAGDLAEDECILSKEIVDIDPPKKKDPKDEDRDGEDDSETSEQALCSKEEALCFDVRDWISTYVKERNMNYGMALISKGQQIITIMGDTSYSQGPEIFWREIRNGNVIIINQQ